MLKRILGVATMISRDRHLFFLVMFALAGAPALAQETEHKVVVQPPSKQAVTRYLYSTGTIDAVASIDLVARVSGTLEKVNQKDGAAVKKGDVLFVIEQEPYQISVASAQASLDQQNANLKQQQDNLARQQVLQKQNATSASTVESAVAQADSAKALVAAAEANLRSAKLNLSYTEITAPFDGILSAHLSDVGAYINAASTPKLASLVQPDPVRVNFTINEKQVVQIRKALAARKQKLGDLGPIKVDIGLPSEDAYEYTGTIDYVAPELDAASGTIAVRAVAENKQGLFSPGMFVRVRIAADTVADALVIPQRAISTGQQGENVLVVNKDNHVEFRLVTSGEQLPSGLQEITKGLTADDRVVVEGMDNVQPGDTATIVDKLQ
jgi:RND family efflux transporter MFP subunit